MKRLRSQVGITDDLLYEELSISKKKNKKSAKKLIALTEIKIEEKKLLKKKPSKKNIKKSKSNIRSKSSVELKSLKLDIEEKRENPESEKMITNNYISKLKSLNFNIDFGPVRIRLGLCCENNFLRAQKETVFCSRSCTLSTYRSKGKQEAIDRAMKNVKDLDKLMLWNKEHYIDVLRISSQLFPHYTNIRNIEEKDRYSLTYFEKELKRLGDLSKKLNKRLTFHPGQFNVVGSPNEQVFKSTCEDLKMHADILDMMGLDYNSIMVVHGGGTYGDKTTTIKRWITNFKRLPESVQKRLVLENCEKNFSVIDCLEINKEIGIPVVFDNHHFNCYKSYHPDDKFEDVRTYISACIDTWRKKGLRPKFHLSEQAKNKTYVGAHSDYIHEFPEYYLEIPKTYKVGIDIMVEAKAKEAAIFDLYMRYKDNFLSHVKNVDDERLKIDRENKLALKCPSCAV